MIVSWERVRSRNRLGRSIDRGCDDGENREKRRKERKQGRARRTETRTRKALDLIRYVVFVYSEEVSLYTSLRRRR